MSALTSIIKFLFGSKADKDRKEIQPYVDKIKAVYPSIEALSNDELREHSAALRKRIADFIAAFRHWDDNHRSNDPLLVLLNS